MRVIAGSARRLSLKTIEGLDTRPTTDRIKETLFNMLQNEIPGCRFLDLFAGSGGIGIEALSRGAREAVFVENNPKAISCIQDNLAFTRLDQKAKVIQADVISALSRLEGESSAFDFIFMDPPYGKEEERRVVHYLTTSSLADSRTVVIVEASMATSFDWVEAEGWQILRIKEYKTNKHIFISKGES
mgnify:FL=1